MDGRERESLVILTIYFSPKKSEKYFSVRPSEPKEIGMSYCKKIKIEEDFFFMYSSKNFYYFCWYSMS